jgi:hypothetical protein
MRTVIVALSPAHADPRYRDTGAERSIWPASTWAMTTVIPGTFDADAMGNTVLAL